MTTIELINKLNTDYGLDKWPESIEVDHETYANCCQRLFEMNQSRLDLYIPVRVYLGKNSGLIFGNIELILKKK